MSSSGSRSGRTGNGTKSGMTRLRLTIGLMSSISGVRRVVKRRFLFGVLPVRVDERV